MENYCILCSNFEMNVCFEYLGGMCALFNENRLGITKSVRSLFTCFVRGKCLLHAEAMYAISIM